MKKNPKELFVLHLGVSGGSVEYTTQILKNLEGDKLIISSQKNDGDIKFLVYTKTTEFLLYTIFLLPLYLIRFLVLITQYSPKTLYLGYIHPWYLPFVIIAKLFKIKIVSTIHDGILAGKNSGSFFIRQIMTFSILNVIKYSDSLIFLTKYVQTETLKKIQFNIPYHIVEHGLIKPDNLLETPRTYRSPLQILFFGRVLESKGVNLLIEAFRALEEDIATSLTIVGKVYYDLPAINDQRIKIIDKFIEDDEISQFFNSSDVLVLPYLEASQSGVVTIGISSRIPIIATRIGGIQEQLSENECLFIEPNNISSIEVALRKLAQNPECYNHLSHALDKKAKAQSWSAIADKINNIIKST